MTSMKNLDVRGEFWLPTAPSVRVPGHLRFNGKTHGRLELHGRLPGHEPRERSRRFPQLFGDGLSRGYILHESFETGARSAETDGVWAEHTTLFVNQVVVTPLPDVDAPAESFAWAQAEFHGLGEFDGRQAMEHDMPDPDDGWRERVTARDLEARVVRLDDATITFGHGVGSRVRHFERTELTSRWWVTIEPDAPETLDELVERVSQVRTLVALAMHQDCRMKEAVTLGPDRSGSGSHRTSRDPLDRYQLHAVWHRGTRHSYPLYNRVLSYDILEPEGIKRWLALEDECGHVISQLSTLRYVKKMAFEDALLRMVAAADSLHRHITEENRVPANRMLAELAHFVGDDFLRQVPDLGSWIEAVVNERHNAAHNKGKPVALPALATPMVSSVYWLVFMTLLRWAAVPDAALVAVSQSQPFLWPMNAIRAEFKVS